MRELERARSGNLFGTPLLSHMWADSTELNPQLRESILEYERGHAGRAQTNIGGWHSDPGMLEFCGSAGQRLIRQMNDRSRRRHAASTPNFPGPPNLSIAWVLSAWANVNRRGDFNEVHTHPGATWSGVYYVDRGESNLDAEGTAIHLYDPYPAVAFNVRREPFP